MLSAADFPDVLPLMAEREVCRDRKSRHHGLQSLMPDWTGSLPSSRVRRLGDLGANPLLACFLAPVMPALAVHAATEAMLSAFGTRRADRDARPALRTAAANKLTAHAG